MIPVRHRRRAGPNLATLPYVEFHFELNFPSRARPRWPSGKVSALGSEGLSSKPDSTEDPPCMGHVARQIIRRGQMSSRRCVVEVWRGGARSGVVLVT
ncbi:hypothetical protein AVEN_169392-1 [Araneus ventricosus]|uniref:Uncharacterized protein n=1 Tax=Araneus ventricosus TaxID=182803 RepID=A0A4Y2LWU6_ARAVE|nr:hypothetical protein AVEN_169392-1 [Araneus ventricosus]